jgi:hypothetical protein
VKKKMSELIREYLKKHSDACDLCSPKPNREETMAKAKQAKPKPVKDNTQVGAVRG